MKPDARAFVSKHNIDGSPCAPTLIAKQFCQVWDGDDFLRPCHRSHLQKYLDAPLPN